MEKVLGIIVAASVIVLISAVIIPTLVSTLGSTGETSNNLQNDSACRFQIERAKESGRPSLVDKRCESYIDDPSFRTEVENSDSSCLVPGTC
jgi:type II secretory pathway pseudopilin PulG